jgi:hypothetical protein
MGIFGGDDKGYAGAYQPLVLGGDALNECRNWLGMPPTPGQKWAMVNLADGTIKWYQATKRSPLRRTFRRRK